MGKTCRKDDSQKSCRKMISISLSSIIKIPHACAGTKPQAARYPHARVFSHPGERRRAGMPEAPYPEGDGGRELGEVVFSPRSAAHVLAHGKMLKADRGQERLTTSC